MRAQVDQCYQGLLLGGTGIFSVVNVGKSYKFG